MTGGQRRRVRMAFIDAPESKQTFGPEAKQMLAARVLRKQVRVHVADTDKYARTVGVIVLPHGVDGSSAPVDVNLSMVRDGGAWLYSYYADSQTAAARAAYIAAQSAAQTARRGLWSRPDGREPENPRDWRLAHPRDDA